MVDFKGDILALDLARQMGYCEGPIHGPLRYGSLPLAPAGSDLDEIFASFFRWLAPRLRAFPPRIFAFEAPLDPRQQPTSEASYTQGIGLAAIARMTARTCGILDVRYGKVRDIKEYWVGTNRIPGPQSKRMIRDKLRLLGYDPQTLDASDAIAVHRFIAATIDPSIRNEPQISGG